MKRNCRALSVNVAWLVLLTVVLVPVCARAQDEVGVSNREAVEQQDRRLLEICSGADGELGADLALRLVETGRLRSPALRLEALELALSKCSDAVEPYPVVMIPRHGNGNREGYREGAIHFFRTDGLSLRCRAVVALLGSDPARARFELERFPVDLDLRAEQCGDALIANPGVFYETLGEVIGRGYTGAERRDGVQWIDAARWIGSIVSLSQIAPAAKLILEIKPPADVTERLTNELATTVAKLPASPRGVVVLGFRSENLESIRALMVSLPRDSAAAVALEQALRKLVISSANAAACRDVGREWMQQVVDTFNTEILPRRQVRTDELKYSTGGEAPVFAEMWTTPVSRRMLFDYQVLNTSFREMDTKADPTQWRLDYLKYLGRLRDWSAASEDSEFDYLVQKASLVSGMLDLAFSNELREEILGDFTVLARHVNSGNIPPTVIPFLVSVNIRKLDPDLRKVVLERLAASGPQSVAAYASLQLEGVDGLRIGVEAPAR